MRSREEEPIYRSVVLAWLVKRAENFFNDFTAQTAKWYWLEEVLNNLNK